MKGIRALNTITKATSLYCTITIFYFMLSSEIMADGIIHDLDDIGQRISTLEANAVRIESGDLTIHSGVNQSIYKPDGCIENHRGTIRQRVSFEKAFKSSPEVMIGLTSFDMGSGLDKVQSRLQINVDEVNLDHFIYSFYTWCDSSIYSARAHWMAVGN